MADWISGLTSKAENLLNTLDQTAAQKLQKDVSSSRPSSVRAPAYESSQQPNVVNEYLSQATRSSGYASSVASWHGGGAAPKQTVADPNFETFLNQTDTADDAHSQHSQKRSHSRRSSNDSMRSLPVKKSDSVVLEIDSLQQSARSAQRTYAVPIEQSTHVGSDRELAELRARDTDAQKSLSMKNSQLAVLRVRLQEAENICAERQKQIDAMKIQLFQLQQDDEKRLARAAHADSQGVSMDADRVKQAEQALEREKQKHNATKTELLAKIDRVQDEQNDMKETCAKLERQIADEKRKCKEFSEQLRLAKYNLEQNKHEFDEYKQKAQRILQVKEKTIETLRQGGPDTHASNDEGKQLAVQLEETANERDYLKEDLQQVHLQLYNTKVELQDISTQLGVEQRAWSEARTQLEDKCQMYHRDATNYREQLEQLKQEYQYTQDELRKQQTAFHVKLAEKDNELTRMLQMQTSSSLSRGTIGNGADDESATQRLRQMTESLIQKQTIIESLQTDKNSLLLQLERLERLYREAENAAMHATSRLTVNDDVGAVYLGGRGGGASSNIPTLLRETPYDTGVARGVKRAYGTLDTLSMRVGLLLRRYPLFRVMLFFYILLLHTWVMFVLLTYTPEIHHARMDNPDNTGHIPATLNEH